MAPHALCRRLLALAEVLVALRSAPLAGAASASDADGEAVLYPAPLEWRPGIANASLRDGGTTLVLANQVLEATWQIEHGLLKPQSVLDRAAGGSLHLPGDAFVVRALAGQGQGGRPEERGDRLLHASEASVEATEGAAATFGLQRLEPDPASVRLGGRSAGWRAEVNLTWPSAPGLRARWSAELRDGAGYLRLAVELTGAPGGPTTALREVVLFEGPVGAPGRAAEARAQGDVQGVPVVGGSFFLGVEHPQASNVVAGGSLAVRCALEQKRTVGPGASHRISLVLGLVPDPTQVRRTFLHYLERERAHPARPMLHYNTWYDIGTGQQFDAKDAVGRMDEIAKALALRGITLDAFLLDDGWDDPDVGPWQPHKGFSEQGLRQLRERAARWETALGVWFSPFGGYHEPRQRRIAAARRAGLEVREEIRERRTAVLKAKGACTKATPCKEGEGDCDSDEDCARGLACFQTELGVSPPGVDASEIADRTADFCFDPSAHSAFLGLGLPGYYAHLRDAVAGWLHGGAQLLKLDGVGNPAGREATSAEDFEAAVALLADLRRIRPDVFINLSTGTWPSPFWLLSADTVWRQGHDHYFMGEGPARERWLTYRDATVYRHTVQRSPVFPVTSLMVHGVIFAKDAWDLNRPEGSGDGLSPHPFRHEVRTAFGSGAMLQELYLTPSLLSQENWDDLASAALWSRARTRTLADAHWVGGDPERGEVYGWAAWRDANGGGGGGAVAAAAASPTATLTLRNPAGSPQLFRLEAGAGFELPPHARGSALDLRSPFRDQRPRRLVLAPGQMVDVLLPAHGVLVFDTESPAPSEWEAWVDALADRAPAIFWSLLAAVAALWAWRSRPDAQAGPPAVPVEELRKKRLEALERRAPPGVAAAAAAGSRETRPAAS